MKHKLYILFIALVATTALWAQNNVITYTATKKLNETFFATETGSKDFWVTLMQADSDNPAQLSLTFSSKQASNVQIDNDDAGYHKTITLGENDIQTLMIYDANNTGQYPDKNVGYVSGPDAETPVYKALHITSDNDISVIAANYRDKSFDVAAILPTAALRSEYRIQCYPPSAHEDASQGTHFVIIAAEDDVEVDYTLSVNSNKQHMAGQTYTTPKMKKGQAFYVWTGNGSGADYDFSGTVVKARDNKKIAVFNGNVHTNIPSKIRDRDHIYSQAMPINYWGKHFAITSSLTTIDKKTGNWERIDKVRIQSVVDSTIIYIDGDSITMIDFSKDVHHTYEFDFGAKDQMTGYTGDGSTYFEGASHYIETSCPCAVHLFMTSNRYDHDKIDANKDYCNGDPSEIWINPIELSTTNMVFGNFETQQVKDHYVNIVTTTSGVGSMVLDGNSISSEFQPVNGNNKYSYARIKIPSQTHTLSGDEGFIAHVYGFGEKESYGYPIGCDKIGSTILPLSGLCGNNLQWELDTITKTLTIIGTGDMYDFTTTTIPWLGLQKYITKVIFPAKLNSIGSWAFFGCSNLTSIEIPNSVTTIGGYAFYGCTGLTSVTIPNSVITIGGYVFYDCSGLTSITCKAVTPPSCDNYCFDGVSTSIPVYVPAGSVEAYKKADEWKNFTNIQPYPSGDDCEPISGTCGANLTWTLTCDSVLTISGTGAMYDYETNQKNSAPWYSSRNNIKYCKIEDGVTTIGERAFYQCSGLTSVTIGNSVTTIGSSAFSGCKGLISVIIPNSVISMGDCVFCDCSGLTSIEIPNSVTTIETETFAGCSGLISVSIPNSVTTINSQAFIGCSSLVSVTIPNSVTGIGYRAFGYCSGLTSITCQATMPPTCGENCFSYVSTSIPVYVPAGSVDAYKEADQWKNFTNIQPIGGDDPKPFDIDKTTTDISEVEATVTVPLDKDGNITEYRYFLYLDSKRTDLVCSMVFNADGKMTNAVIKKAPSRDHSEMAETASSFSFEVSGLQANTTYWYTLEALSTNQTYTKQGSFTTGSTSRQETVKKLIRNGRILISTQGAEYTILGNQL